MRICRFDPGRVGIVRGEQVFDITEYAQRAAAGHGADALGDPLIASLATLKKLLPANLDRCEQHALSQVRLLSPVRAPGKIVAAPVNYHAHIAEMAASNVSPGFNVTDIQKAGLFLKASSSLVGPAQGIAMRFLERRTDFEIELVAVIGREASDVPRESALDYVAGYCIGLDITVRGTEERSFRKSIDSYAVLGPWFTTADEVPDPSKLHVTLRQNGAVRQDSPTSDMIFDVPRLIEFASSFYTLQPGDLIYTGTPHGVGPIRPGDALRAECTSLGAMDVAVRAYRDERSKAAA